MDINTIQEIIVKTKKGEEVIYRGRGLEKFRKDIRTSPPLGGSQTVIDDENEPAGQFALRVDPRHQETNNKMLSQMKGYHTTSLNYTPSNLTPYELAQQMKSEAEKSGRLHFSH